MSIQILHCSDLHLDRNFGISNTERALRRKEDLTKNFFQIVDYALTNKPDFFIVTGDIFDKVSPSNPPRVLLTQKIRELRDAGIRVFIIGGNHDVPKSMENVPIAIDILHSAGLATVFSNTDNLQKQIIEVNGKTVCLSGKSWNPRNEMQNPLRGEIVPMEGHYNVLLLHASFHGLNVVPSNLEYIEQNPIHAEDIPKRLNYLALGHYHNPFVRAFHDCTICNPGSIEKISWSELADQKSFIWAEIHDREVTTELIPLKTRPMETAEYVLSKESGSVLKALDTYLETVKDTEKILRLYLKGLIAQQQLREFNLSTLYRSVQNLFFHFDLNRQNLEVEGYGRLFSERIDNPLEAFSKRMDILASKAAGEQEKESLSKMKELGIKYLSEAT